MKRFGMSCIIIGTRRYNGNREYLIVKRFKTTFPKSIKKNKEKINKYIERMQVPFVFVCVNEWNVRLQITYSNITMGTIPMGIKQNQKYK